MTPVVAVVLLVVLVASYLTWLATRLDRLGARVADARAGLIIALAGRAGAAMRLADRCTAGLAGDGPLAGDGALAGSGALAGNEGRAGTDGPDAGRAGRSGRGGPASPASIATLRSAARAAAAGQSRIRAGAPLDAAAEDVENTLSRALRMPGVDVTAPAASAALHEVDLASARVALARQFYNDAVRDMRALRGRRLVRAVRLAAHRPTSEYFEIDDALTPPHHAPARQPS